MIHKLKVQSNPSLLHNWLIDRWEILHQEVLKELKWDLILYETLRSKELQMKYFREGKSKLDGIKNKSLHQLGLAFDCQLWIDNEITWELPKWRYITPIANRLELEHGASWKFVDVAHFQPNKHILKLLRDR